jgi:hypothetical protein
MTDTEPNTLRKERLKFSSVSRYLGLDGAEKVFGSYIFLHCFKGEFLQFQQVLVVGFLSLRACSIIDQFSIRTCEVGSTS